MIATSPLLRQQDIAINGKFSTPSGDSDLWDIAYTHSQSSHPYLPLAGGTVTGATTFNAAVSVPTLNGVTNINGAFGGILQSSDEWLRINPNTDHTLGVYFYNSVVRTDGELQVGSTGAQFRASSTVFTYQGNNIYHAGNLVAATQSVTGLMSATDKTKLDGIAASANNYVHPTYTSRSIDTAGIEVIDVITSDASGHITNVTKRSIQSASTSVQGVVQLVDTLDSYSATMAATANAARTLSTRVAHDYFRKWKVMSAAGAESFLLGKIKSAASLVDGGISFKINFSHDYGNAKSARVEGSISQRSGVLTAHWHKYGTFDSEPMYIEAIQDGSGYIEIWATVVDFNHATVEASIRDGSDWAASGLLVAATKTTGTVLCDTRDASTDIIDTGTLQAATVDGTAVYGDTVYGTLAKVGDGACAGSFPLTIQDSQNLGWKVMNAAGDAKFELYCGWSSTEEMRLLNGISLIGHNQDLVLGTSSYKTAMTVQNADGHVKFAGSPIATVYKLAYGGFTKDAIVSDAGDANGISIRLGAGSYTVIGSGEAAAAVTAGGESLSLASDDYVYLYSNLQNGWANRKSVTMDLSGNLKLDHGNLNIQSQFSIEYNATEDSIDFVWS